MPEVDEEGSRKLLSVATDVRPTENVTGDKRLAEHGERGGKELTEEESAAILRLATDIRPGENFHPDDGPDAIVLVTGATGTQGQAVARTLLGRGAKVRALVRDLGSIAARSLSASGVELVEGHFDEPRSLSAATKGAVAVFSSQMAPPATDQDQERRHAHALIEAARSAGVRHFIQTSVSNTGDFRTMTGWADGRWGRNYWESKGDVEDMVRAAGFPFHTILRPAFMMDNFAQPKAAFMFPDLARGEILTAIEPDTKLPLIAADDIGLAVAAAIASPESYGGAAIELAGDWLTLGEIAVILGQLKGLAITVRTLDPAELIARGQSIGWVESQQWQNVVGYPARPVMMEEVGLAPTRFADWAAAHLDDIEVR